MAREWTGTMNDIADREFCDEDILIGVPSDEELEAAVNIASVPAALSFPSAPTVSILIMCCSNE